MAEFEIGQKVRVKAGTDSLYAGENAVVEKLHGSGPVVVVGDGSRLLYLESELEPIETFLPGDIVRAEKGDEIIQGEVFIDAGDQTLYIDISFGAYIFTLEELRQEGYTLTLVKRPEPEIVLPTKPGMYFVPQNKRVRDEKWHTDGKIFFYLNTDGMWIDLGWGQPSVIDGELKVYKNE